METAASQSSSNRDRVKVSAVGRQRKRPSIDRVSSHDIYSAADSIYLQTAYYAKEPSLSLVAPALIVLISSSYSPYMDLASIAVIVVRPFVPFHWPSFITLERNISIRPRSFFPLWIMSRSPRPAV
ncbi:unnamed protein product [Peniophora sp. CBMAI 1063]|nr:unnamed protein product [Peniophora sp. CBMAI 1063]